MTCRRRKGCLNEFQIAKSLVTVVIWVFFVYAGLFAAFSFKCQVCQEGILGKHPHFKNFLGNVSVRAACCTLEFYECVPCFVFFCLLVLFLFLWACTEDKRVQCIFYSILLIKILYRLMKKIDLIMQILGIFYRQLSTVCGWQCLLLPPMWDKHDMFWFNREKCQNSKNMSVHIGNVYMFHLYQTANLIRTDLNHPPPRAASLSAVNLLFLIRLSPLTHINHSTSKWT